MAPGRSRRVDRLSKPRALMASAREKALRRGHSPGGAASTLLRSARLPTGNLKTRWLLHLLGPGECQPGESHTWARSSGTGHLASHLLQRLHLPLGLPPGLLQLLLPPAQLPGELAPTQTEQNSQHPPTCSSCSTPTLSLTQSWQKAWV